MRTVSRTSDLLAQESYFHPSPVHPECDLDHLRPTQHCCQEAIRPTSCIWSHLPSHLEFSLWLCSSAALQPLLLSPPLPTPNPMAVPPSSASAKCHLLRRRPSLSLLLLPLLSVTDCNPKCVCLFVPCLLPPCFWQAQCLPGNRQSIRSC